MLQAMRMLIRHIQIHRGLMSAYFAGNSGKREQIEEMKTAVSADFNNMSYIADSENDDWVEITKHWARLSNLSHEKRPLELYEQHCQLIASVLSYMLHVATEYRLVKRYLFNEKISWFELLSLGEKIGQLRALGVFFLTNQQGSDVNITCLNKVNRVLIDVDKLLALGTIQSKLGRENLDQLAELLAFINIHIVNSMSYIPSDYYFSYVTRSIDLLYEKFDEEMQKLLRNVHRQISKNTL